MLLQNTDISNKAWYQRASRSLNDQDGDLRLPKTSRNMPHNSV